MKHNNRQGLEPRVEDVYPLLLFWRFLLARPGGHNSSCDPGPGFISDFLLYHCGRGTHGGGDQLWWIINH